MSDSLITIGCLMAEVFEHESGEIRSSSEHAASFAYCQTTESESEKLIVTREMHQFGDAGYLPIAIARIDPNDPSQFIVCAIRDLSEGLQYALEHQGHDLIRSAFGCFTDEQHASKVWH